MLFTVWICLPRSLLTSAACETYYGPTTVIPIKCKNGRQFAYSYITPMLTRMLLCQLRHLLDRGSGILLVHSAFAPRLRRSTVSLGNGIYCVNSSCLCDPRSHTGSGIRGDGIPYRLLKICRLLYLKKLTPLTITLMMVRRLKKLLLDRILLTRTLPILKNLCSLNGVKVPLLNFYPLMRLPGGSCVAPCDRV